MTQELQEELELMFSSFQCLKHIADGTIKQETDELWAEIEIALRTDL